MKPSERCEGIRNVIGEVMVHYEGDLKAIGLLSVFKDVVVQLRVLELETKEKKVRK